MRPVAGRNAFYRMVFDEVMAARAAGLPVGGTLFWMLSGEWPAGGRAGLAEGCGWVGGADRVNWRSCFALPPQLRLTHTLNTRPPTLHPPSSTSLIEQPAPTPTTTAPPCSSTAPPTPPRAASPGCRRAWALGWARLMGQAARSVPAVPRDLLAEGSPAHPPRPAPAPRTPQKRPDEVALLYAQFALWRNFDAMVACLGAQAGNGTEPAWSGGWPDTLALIRGQVAAMGGP